MKKMAVLLICLMTLGTGGAKFSAQAQEDLLQDYTFSDGTTLQIPAAWRVDMAGLADFITLSGQREQVYVSFYDPQAQADYEILTLVEAMNDTYIPLSAEASFDPEAVQVRTLGGVDLSFWRYGAGATPGVVVAGETAAGSFLVLDAFAVALGSAAEGLVVAMALDALGGEADVAAAFEIYEAGAAPTVLLDDLAEAAAATTNTPIDESASPVSSIENLQPYNGVGRYVGVSFAIPAGSRLSREDSVFTLSLNPSLRLNFAILPFAGRLDEAAAQSILGERISIESSRPTEFGDFPALSINSPDVPQAVLLLRLNPGSVMWIEPFVTTAQAALGTATIEALLQNLSIDPLLRDLAGLGCQVGVSRAGLSVNVRAEANTNSEVVRQIEDGDAEIVLAQARAADGLWYQLNGGGWVRSDVVAPVQEAMAAICSELLPPAAEE